MKKLLPIFFSAFMLISLSSCEETASVSEYTADNSPKESIVSSDAPQFETILSDESTAGGEEAIAIASQAYWNDYYERLSAHPDGKEVAIFKDNTQDDDYSGYRKVAYDFLDKCRSVMIPQEWNNFKFYPNCDEGWDSFENMLTGTAVYAKEPPQEIDRFADHTDYSSYFANQPMEKATFFLAETPWEEPYWISEEYIHKYDHETYTDKQGRTMQVYFLDGLPKYACYDDFFDMCIWFNLEDEEQIPTVVSMINSIEIGLSSDAKHALYTAESLGYTIIPPAE